MITVHDKALKWEQKASDYKDEIEAAIKSRALLALVELTLDMGRLDQHNITIIDHHGERAGADQPSSLRQTWQMA